MKYVITIINLIFFYSISFSQLLSTSDFDLIRIEHLCGNVNHYIPALYIYNSSKNKDIPPSNRTRLNLNIDSSNFKSFSDFILKNDTHQDITSQSNYVYGSFAIVLYVNGKEYKNYVIIGRISSKSYFYKLMDYIKLNSMDDNLYDKIFRIVPDGS